MRKLLVGLLGSLMILNLTACGGDYSDGDYSSSNYSSSSYSGYESASYTNDSGYGLKADISSGSSSEHGFIDNISMAVNSSNKYSEVEYEEASVEDVDISDEEQSSKAKLIRTVNIALRSASPELQSVNDMLEAKAEEFGGYIENSEVYNYENRSNSALVARIPADRADAFLEYLNASGLQLKSIRDNLEDVTLEYMDVQTRINVLEAQKSKYMGYMEQAESVTDILEIEEQLQDVIYELDSVQSRMNILSNKIIYSTFKITVDYNKVDTTTFLGKVLDTFDDVGYHILNALEVCFTLIFEGLLPALVFTFIIFLCIKLFMLLLKIGKKGGNTKAGKNLLGKFKGTVKAVKNSINEDNTETKKED